MLDNTELFQKILYTTDFSKASEKALDYVIKLKGAGAEEVIILHVVDISTLEAYEDIYSLKGMSSNQIIETIKNEIKKKLEGIEEKIRAQGLKTKVLVRIGKSYKEIVKVAEEENVSLIVIASIGRGVKWGVFDVFLGSTAGKVVARAKRPVLVVK
ncbi:universal stress protein [Staphylothermus hellenicus]|uniref:UspA domain protein n=1 Tax=Staphylothermus hellenicus (strain DSM 12710 / JCM 10830 / BK20S6-10-b1 / P8) TaxID=591019 RepID=D7DAS6_STAHD|nr:universal stress protein [Staphylothermus hellenicus]ADI31273.1 UspA domain protein [Staphylothermus hellenicus DSM 12710]